MPGHVRVSGSWNQLVQPASRVSGAWQDTVEGHLRTGGAWQTWFLGSVTFTVTIGSGSVGKVIYDGYNSGTSHALNASAFGSRSPTTAYGHTIVEAYWLNGTAALGVTLATPNLGASLITQISVSGHGSDSSLSYSTDGSTYSQWTCDNLTGTLAGSGTEIITLNG